MKKHQSHDQPFIFLCHAKEDIQDVRQTYDTLKKANLNPWLDEINLLAGQDWNLEIQKAIDKTDYILIFLSKQSVKKTGYLNKEIKWSLEKQDEQPEGGICIIPVRLDECDLPYSLKTLQAVDLFEPDGLEKLIHSLKHQTDVVNSPQENPYVNREMLPPHSDMFFGREKELKTIRELLSKPKSVSIIGERRIGKSSLANRLYHELQSSPKTLAIFIDCDEIAETCHTRDDFFTMINNKLKESDSSHHFPYADHYFTCFTTFKRFIAKQAKQGFKCILFMDEFEALPKKTFADDTFFSNLRSIANNTSNHFAFVTVSKKDLSLLAHKAIDSSNFWNIFTPKILAMMDKDSINELRSFGFKSHSMALTETDINTMDQLAGRFPFFNQIVCWHIFDSKKDQVQVNVHQIKSDLITHYQTIWDSRSRQEQQILKKLSHPKISKYELQMNDMIVRELAEVNNNKYVTFSQFFGELVQHSFMIKGKA
jgi:hypothetical protein